MCETFRDRKLSSPPVLYMGRPLFGRASQDGITKRQRVIWRCDLCCEKVHPPREGFEHAILTAEYCWAEPRSTQGWPAAVIILSGPMLTVCSWTVKLYQ